MKHFKSKLFRHAHGGDLDKRCKKWKRGPCMKECHFGPSGPCAPKECSSGSDCGPDKEHRMRHCKRGRDHHGPYHGHHGHHGKHHGRHGPPHGHGHGPRHVGYGPVHCGHGPHYGGHGPFHGGFGSFDGPHHGGRGPRGCHGPCEINHDSLRRRFKDWSKEELLLVLINTIERGSPRVTEIMEEESGPEVAKDQACDRNEEGTSKEKEAEKEKAAQTPAQTSDSERPQSE